MKDNENPVLKFQITLNEANMILAGLQELPAKICNPLSQKLQAQAKVQIDAIQKEIDESQPSDSI